MNTKTLKQLKSEQSKTQKLLRNINSEIEKRELQKILPKLKKQYEGRYWKYYNGINKDCRWALYSYCKKVIDDRHGLFDCFETTKANYSENTFRHNQQQYLHLCQIQITKEEYLKELSKFQNELSKLSR